MLFLGISFSPTGILVSSRQEATVRSNAASQCSEGWTGIPTLGLSRSSWVGGQFDGEAALRRHLARLTRRYSIKLTHYPILEKHNPEVNAVPLGTADLFRDTRPPFNF